MKRSSSSSLSSTSASASLKKPSAAPKGAALGLRKKPANARSPLQQLNGVLSCSSGTNASCSSSTSTSIEAPRGCLRFFLPHSSSAKTKAPLSNRNGPLPGTPKSAVATEPKKNTNPSMRGRKSKACSGSGNVVAETLKKNQGFELAELDLSGDSGTNCTPVSKIPSGSRLELGLQCRADENSNSNETRMKTPPIEASASPEIQGCGLNVLSTVKMESGAALLQPCYGAGHVLSGIADKRKCKPRGILTMRDNDSEFNLDVLENANANDDDGSSAVGVCKSSRLYLVPLPGEASIQWLSPCHDRGEEDQKKKSPDQRLEGSVSMSLCSSSPSLSGTGFSSDVFYKSSLTSSATDASSGNSRRGSSALRRSSRGRLLDFKGFGGPMYEVSSPSHMTQIFSTSTSKEGGKSSFYVDRDDTPFSTGSLGSGNVIQTPNSDPASKNPSENLLDSEMNLIGQAFGKVTLSPEHHLSTWDPADLSFRLDYLNTPCNSIDLAQVQKVVDSKAASWVSNTTSDFIPSQDPLRISWRDGLVSRIFEMDEYDCCRCFSDEEGEGFNVKPSNTPGRISGIRDNMKLETDQELEVNSHMQSMYLESLSSDGDRLIASEDSNWNFCCKNHLFAA
ncbi:uncharacterized protein LOC116202570 [Punica granatum]|nr:uncharacterized protein LOC116202570 [Punica granatum]OWM84796.1 hypothetical protein CDL15_Pgr027583 [Punica granatum]